MDNPQISVIIPAHNAAPFLVRCTDSVLGQPGPSVEIILVDDSSDDETGVLCDTLAAQDRRIHALHRNFRDVSLTRNAGLEAARGEYVLFIDGDDVIAPDALSGLWEIVQAHRPDMIRFGFQKIMAGKTELWCPTEPEGLYRDEALELQRLDAVCFANVLDYSRPRMLSACACLFSRDFLCRNQIRFTAEREILNEDYLFVVQTLWKARSVFVCSRPYYHYLLRSSSLSTSPRPEMYRRKQNLFRIYQQIVPADSPEGAIRLRNFYIDCIYNCFVEVCLTSPGLKEALPRIRPLLEDTQLQQFLRQNKDRIASAKTRAICFLMTRKMARSMFLLYRWTTKLTKK